MGTFEDLGIAPELVEALVAEGIERPTPLQESAIPVIRKGNNLVLEAGPGSGLLVTWSVGLLDRVEPGGDAPRVLVVCATPEIADRLARSTASIAEMTGHAVSALGSAWAMPERADVLFAGAPDLLGGVAEGGVDVSAVEAVVFDQAQLTEEYTGIDAIERVLDYVPGEAQRILTALPMSDGISRLVGRLFKRTMTLPSPETDVTKRGEVHFRIAPDREGATLRVVDELLEDGARHVLVFCRSEDRAADIGDHLTLHGFIAGAPGDPSVPVWLGVDALEARSAAKDAEGLVVLSCDPPTDPDMLDRRHSMGGRGVIIVLPREVPHLRALGKRTGYDTVPFPPPPTQSTSVTRLRARIEEAIAEKDTGPYLVALEPLFERYDPADVAAAAVTLLREAGTSPAVTGDTRPAASSGASAATAVPSWTKLFVSVGERDGLRPGDLLGAITGEANVSGDAVGKIDIHESHTLVEVHDTVARQVIGAINGTTIKGRSARVDFDRPRRTQQRKPPRGPGRTR